MHRVRYGFFKNCFLLPYWHTIFKVSILKSFHLTLRRAECISMLFSICSLSNYQACYINDGLLGMVKVHGLLSCGPRIESPLGTYISYLLEFAVSERNFGNFWVSET